MTWKEFVYLNEVGIIQGESYMSMKRLCKKAGCNRLAEYPHKYCSLHEYLEREEQEKENLFFHGKDYSPEYRDLYTTSKWKEMSRRQLKKEPLCAYCGNKATVVDHIQPHRGNLDLFYNEDNLQSLCKECHDLKTRKEIGERQKELKDEYNMRTRHHLITDNYRTV